LILDKKIESVNVRMDEKKPGRIKMQTNDQPTITRYSDEEKDNEKDNAEEEEEEEEKYYEEDNTEEE
jgi:hypothetical protein